MSKQAVTVIGLGPMGQAMVGAFLKAGHEVTVWNRTAAKADALVAQGARRAATVQEALAANELVVLSLTDYEALYAILEPATDALSGRTLVNLSSDTPAKARAAAVWAAGHGARYLTGGVNVPPSGIGSPESVTFYSGPRDLFEEYRDTLQVLTGTDYRGEDQGLAALYYQIGIDLFWTALTGYLHAQALAGANGIPAVDFRPYALRAADIGQFIDFYAPRIDAGDHGGDVERITMAVASLDHVVQTAKDSGVDPALPAAVLETFRKGAAAGYGQDSLTSLVKVFWQQGAS